MPLKTKKLKKMYARELRAKFKARGICYSCCQEPVARRLVNGQWKELSRCIKCQRRNAWFTSERRERLKRERVRKAWNHDTRSN